MKLGHSLPEDSGNATKFKGGAGSKKKSGFWNCCSGGSTGSGYPCKLKFVLLILLLKYLFSNFSNWIIIITSKLDEDENAINENYENDIELKEGDVIPQMGGEDGSSSLEKSGGSLKSQSGTLKQGSVGHGKSGGSGIQINENIYESPTLTEYPGADSQGSVGHGKSEGSQGSGQNSNQTNENIYESLPLPENPGNDKELKEDAVSYGHLGGN